MITVDYASGEDIERLMGERPAKTVRAVAIKEGDEVLGIACLFVDETRQGVLAEFTDRARADKRAMVRLYRMMVELAKRAKLPTYAQARPDIPKAKEFLEHIGFKHFFGDNYVWPGPA